MSDNLKSYSLLHVTDGYGDHKFYIDGRRTTKASFDNLLGLAVHRESMSTIRKKACWHHRTEIRL